MFVFVLISSGMHSREWLFNRFQYSPITLKERFSYVVVLVQPLSLSNDYEQRVSNAANWKNPRFQTKKKSKKKEPSSLLKGYFISIYVIIRTTIKDYRLFKSSDE